MLVEILYGLAHAVKVFIEAVRVLVEVESADSCRGHECAWRGTETGNIGRDCVEEAMTVPVGIVRVPMEALRVCRGCECFRWK